MLFPGQGAHLPGAFACLAAKYDVVDLLLREVDQVAAVYSRAPISPLLLDPEAPGTDELMREDPARAHLAIYASSVVLHHILTEVHGMRSDVLAGHSFGEIAALASGGAFDVRDGARIVAERDAAFERCDVPRGGLLSLRTGTARATHLVAAASTWHTTIAAENSPSQTVVSGPDDELKLIETMAVAAGITTRRLRAPYPFHNRLLHPVADVLAEQISTIPARAPRTRVYSPVLGRYYYDDDDVRQAIVAHLVRPVRFADAVRALFADGADVFVETGARSILCDLAAGSLPGIQTCAPLRTRCDANEFASRISEITGRSSSAVPDPRRQPDPVTAAPAQREQLVELLAQEYANGLGYPLDVFTVEADLEADLGVDSIKQTEIFTRMREKLGLPPAEGVRVTSLRTLGDVADLLARLGAANELPSR